MKVKNNYRKTIIILCVGGLLTIVGIWLFWFRELTNKIAPFQKTDDWSNWETRLPEGVSKYKVTEGFDIPIDKKPGIMLRTDSSNNLILKHSYGNEVYFYNRQNKVITLVSEDIWGKANGNITYCSSTPYKNERVARLSGYPTYDVTIRGVPFKTRGKIVIDGSESPSQKTVAVLTADGPVGFSFPSFAFGLGGGEPTVYGRRYVEIIELGKPDFVQEPIGLEFAKSKYSWDFILCWSKDEKYVVAYKPYDNFSIIEVGENQ
jgi:hypothetical protein